MDIRELKTLANLQKTGSITRTAEVLHLTPSAVHRQLKVLAEDLDLPVYERHDGSLRLTDAANSLMPLIEDLLVQYDAIIAAARDCNSLHRGSVRLGSGPTFGSYVLPRLLEEFRTRHAQLDVYVEAGHTTQLLAELAEGAIDLVFLVPHPAAGKKFVVERTWTFEVPMVTTPRYAPARRVPIRSLGELPFLLYRQGSYFEQQIDRYLEGNDFAPKVVMRLDNAEPIKALVRSGFGISLLPIWAVEHELESGELVRVRVQEPPLTCKLSLIRRRSKYVSRPVAAMIELAKKFRWHKLP